MWWLARPALACGGFFCNNVDPVVQSAERILFRRDAEEWTTFVEVQYEGPPDEFGWVIPIPRALDPATEIGVASPGLFDALEQATAPRFVPPGGAPAADAAYYSAGCGCYDPWSDGWSDGGTFAPDLSGVELVGEAVVGPYELQVLTADDGYGLTAWLQQAGYQIPYAASWLIDGYLQEGWAFLGIKLAPDVPAGPIDTLVLRCGADDPRIPLRLTSIAAVPDMEIVAYVLADRRYTPGADWIEVPFDPAGVWLYPDGTDDYEYQLRDAVDAALGHGFRTEYAQPAEVLVPLLDPTTAEALGSGAWLTRLRSFVSPEQMTSDPVFVPDPLGEAVDNVVVVSGGSTARLGGIGVLLLVLAGAARRRG
jgi:hypothetical protein